MSGSPTETSPNAYITGSTGFVGSHLAELLAAQGAKLKLLVRSPKKLESSLRDRAEIVAGSLEDAPQKLAAGFEGVDEIYHVAGLIGAIRQADFDRVNVEGTRNLIEAISLSGHKPKRLLLVSSLAAHGPSPGPQQPRREEEPSDPRTMYGRSKLAGEQLAVELCERYSIPLTVVRPPAVYGPRDTATFELFKLMAKGLELTIGREKRHFDLIHVRDLVEGMVAAARSPTSVGKAYYLTNEGAHELSEVLAVMREVMRPSRTRRFAVPVPVVKALALFNDLLQRVTGKVRLPNSDKLAEMLPTSWCCSGERAREDFDFSCSISLREGLDEASRWYQESGWLKVK